MGQLQLDLIDVSHVFIYIVLFRILVLWHIDMIQLQLRFEFAQSIFLDP